MSQPPRLSRKLLCRACQGNREAMGAVERRVRFLDETGRAGVAKMLGDPMPEHASVVAWLENHVRTDPREILFAGASEESQLRVFELVYPLVAHLPRVRQQVVLRVAGSPDLLAAALRLGRELLGAPQVTGLRFSDGGSEVSPLILVAGNRPRTGDCVDILVEAGADLELRSVNGDTPLIWIARTNPGGLALLEALIRRGADVKARNSVRENILHALARWGVSQPGSEALVAFLALGRIISRDDMRELLAMSGISGKRPQDIKNSTTHNVMMLAAIEHGLGPALWTA